MPVSSHPLWAAVSALAEGAGEEDEQADTELRAQAVASYLDLLDKPKLSAVLLKVGMRSIWSTEAVC